MNAAKTKRAMQAFKNISFEGAFPQRRRLLGHWRDHWRGGHWGLRRGLRRVFLIAWTDFRQAISHPLSALVLGACCLLISYIFPRELFRFAAAYIMPAFQQTPGQQNIHAAVFIPHIQLVNLLLLFLVPVLSMKALAEEKKNKTFDLLMSAPLSPLQIVAGKYIALFMTVSVFLFTAMLYPLSVSLFVEIPGGLFFTSWTGLFLLAAVYSAAGLLASAFTASSMLSVIMGVIFNFFIWFVSHGKDVSDNPLFQAVMDYLSLSDHLVNFIQGSLVVSSFVFFFSCILFFLFLVYKVLEFSKWRP